MSATTMRRRGRAAAVTAALALATAAVTASLGAAEATEATARPAAVPGATAVVATSEQLRTWWHDNGEPNAGSAVAQDNVRQSTFYDVQVATAAAPQATHDSFVYMSLPRSGKDKIGYSSEDGAEFSDAADLTMSWSSFEYATDVWVDVHLRTGQAITSADEVTIRPTSLGFEKQLVDSSTIRVKVPYSPDGYRFSVEFDPQLITSYNDMSGNSGILTTEAEGNRTIHTEPQNSMLIFAEPVLTDDLIPTAEDGSIYYAAPGEVRNLDTISEDIVYFAPGTYFMGSDYHAMLPEQVKWIYLAPGAYVKGAFRFPSDLQDEYRVTGYGVLSGEQYVYEADTREGYQHRSEDTNCHADCVKMLQFASKNAPQHLVLQGVTVNEPPYHSFVVYGNEQTFTMDVANYKQVGSWYWQTDGIELYQGGRMKNTFFNANDDVLKMYHSDVRIDNTVIWKNENGPVIQWGWTPREIDDVVVTNTHVIHNRMYWKDVKYNTCILNSSSHWEDMESTATANPAMTVKNMRFENITVEGMTNCALRVYALSDTENIHIKNLSIDAWNHLDPSSQASHLKRYTNAAGEKVTIGNETDESRGIKLENFSVGGEIIEKTSDNWRSEGLGRLDFDGENWESWNAWASLPVDPDPEPEPEPEETVDPTPEPEETVDPTPEPGQTVDPTPEPEETSDPTTAPGDESTSTSPSAGGGDGSADGTSEAAGTALPNTGAGPLALVGVAALVTIGAGALLRRRAAGTE